MTGTINRMGIFGNGRYGERVLTLEEYNTFKDRLPYPFEDVVYRIGVVAYKIMVPIIPRYTSIYVEFLEYRDKDNNKKLTLDRRSFYRDLHTDAEKAFAWTNYALKKGVWRTNRCKECLKISPDWNSIESRTAFYFSPTLLPLMLIHKLIKVIRDKKSHKEVPHANGS